jgi:hypothetical protein
VYVYDKSVCVFVCLCGSVGGYHDVCLPWVQGLQGVQAGGAVLPLAGSAQLTGSSTALGDRRAAQHVQERGSVPLLFSARTLMDSGSRQAAQLDAGGPRSD